MKYIEDPCKEGESFCTVSLLLLVSRPVGTFSNLQSLLLYSSTLFSNQGHEEECCIANSCSISVGHTLQRTMLDVTDVEINGYVVKKGYWLSGRGMGPTSYEFSLTQLHNSWLMTNTSGCWPLKTES